MRVAKWLSIGVLLALVLASAGCARTARDTQGFAVADTAVLEAPFEEAWQSAKAVLRERDYDIYTRDKRGVFVAYSRMKRSRLLIPKRVKFTIALAPISDSATELTVESIRQVFGVTLLTYPGWHDRQTTDRSETQAILEAIQAKVAGGTGATASIAESAPVAQANSSPAS